MRRFAARPLILGVVMAIVSVAASLAPRHTSQTATTGVVLAVLSVAALVLSAVEAHQDRASTVLLVWRRHDTGERRPRLR